MQKLWGDEKILKMKTFVAKANLRLKLTVKRYNTIGLLEDGKFIHDFDYWLQVQILTDKEVTVSVWGGNWKIKGHFCLSHQIYKPTDGRVPVAKTKDFNTDTLQLKMHNTIKLFLFIRECRVCWDRE